MKLHPTRSCSRLRLAATLVAIFTGLSLHAGEILVIGKPPRSTDEATIRKQEDETRHAVRDRDYAALERLWSEDFVVNTPANFVVTSRSAVLDLFRKGKGTYSSYEKNLECITFNGDLAIVMGMETVAPINAKPGQTAQRRYTNVWRFEKGAWQLIARQATYLSPDAASFMPSPPKP